MISLQKNFLFVHIPKTGGNSLQNILKDFSEDEIVASEVERDRLERFNVKNAKYKTSKHSALTDYKLALEPDNYRGLFKFATIRNPWDRMVSYYFSPHRGVSEFDRAEFVKLVNRVPALRHYISERSLLERLSRKLGAEISINNKSIDQDIDFLIRFEHLNEDFQTVCEKLGIPCTPLPQKNASKREHYSTYYDDELIELVGTKFAEEIALGSYEFETVTSTSSRQAA